MTSILTTRETEALLRKAADAYYNGKPIMSDKEFDELWKAHKAHRDIDPTNQLWKDTILDRVGAAPRVTEGRSRIKHRRPMMSLDNVFVQEGDNPLAELATWLGRLKIAPSDIVVVEPKIDGLSASVIYENGILQRVVTRGDKDEGEDITANALAAKLVPTTMVPDAPFNGAGTWDGEANKGTREFRGEIYMPFSAFEALKEKAALAGEDPPANPRNAATGIILRKDPQASAGFGLKFMVHGVEDPMSNSYTDELSRLIKFGFNVPTRGVFRADERLDLQVFKCVLSKEYPTDGLVFKMDNLALRQTLGFTSRAPKWAIALKLEQEQVETICSDITVQVGRSGVLTPVAELVPVEVDGSVVSRATLHNESQVNRLGLMVGDKVVIQKAGGIIPEIVNVVGKHTKPRPRFSLLKHIGHQCPTCGSPDILVDGDIEDSMVFAEIKRKNDATDVESDGKLNLGKIRRRLQSVIESLSEGTVTQLRDDNRPGMELAEFKDRWLSDMVVNVAAEGLRYACGNPRCKAKMAARIEHMASRGCLNIDQLGGELATALADGKGMGGAPKYHPFEILDKQAPWFARIEWTTESGGKMSVGDSRANKIRAGIEAAFKLPLNRWIAALGIPSIGENTSKEISRLFASARELMLMHRDAAHGLDTDTMRISVVEAIAKGASKTEARIAAFSVSQHLGPVSCQALLDFVNSEAGVSLLQRIEDYGVKSDNYDPIPTVKEVTGALVGKTFAITGTMSQPRDYFKRMIEASGGKVTDTISAKLTALVCGLGGGGKRDKAAKLGIAVWDENQLRDAAR